MSQENCLQVYKKLFKDLQERKELSNANRIWNEAPAFEGPGYGNPAWGYSTPLITSRAFSRWRPSPPPGAAGGLVGERQAGVKSTEEVGWLGPTQSSKLLTRKIACVLQKTWASWQCCGVGDAPAESTYSRGTGL